VVQEQETAAQVAAAVASVLHKAKEAANLDCVAELVVIDIWNRQQWLRMFITQFRVVTARSSGVAGERERNMAKTQGEKRRSECKWTDTVTTLHFPR